MSAISKTMRMGLFFALLGVCGAAMGETLPTPRMQNEGAVRLVASGERTTASAAWWGFNAEDVKDTLQTALDSKAKTFIIPYMGEAWIVRPLRMHGDQTIVFEPGVMLLAKKGEFLGGGDSL